MASTNVYTCSFSFWSSIAHQRHDVFLSFRGEDTRHGLAQDLHSALLEAGIPTYRDDANLEQGREIASELLKSIQMSRVAIIVFSRNYATSSWCLDELVKILECKRIDGRCVVPVFFDVDPDDVGRQMGPFGEAFEERFVMNKETTPVMENKVEKWREALAEAANLPGFALPNISQGHDSMFIQEIINQISNRRQDAHFTLHLQPTVEDGIEFLNQLLSVVSDDVLIIGIYGMSNIGKTNIAKYVYNQNFLRFDGSSFLANVDEVSEQPNGLVQLQKELLSGILMDEDNIEIDNVSMGVEMIKTILPSKRVLIVLDDVDKLDQLNSLARRRDWFGPGSRIIITTRDANFLSILESDDVYGKQGIQIIKDKYSENLKEIEVLEEVSQKLHSQAERKVRSLIAEIQREQKNNAIQAQMITELQPNRDHVLSLALHTVTRDLVSNESAGYDWDLGDFCEILFDPEPGKEIAKMEKKFGDHKGKNSFSIEIETRGLARKRSRDEAAECSTSKVIEDKDSIRRNV